MYRMWITRRALAVLVTMLAGILAGGTRLEAAQKSEDIPLGPSCVTAECHQDVKSAQFLHGPVNLNQCEPCHIPQANRHVFKPAAEGRALCLTCHEEEPAKKMMHGPYQTDCTFCHLPHGGDNRRFMKGGEGAKACQLCHGDVTEKLAFVHGPLALGECIACHSPHQSDYDKLLTDDPKKLCLSCHVDMEKTIQGAVSVHKPVGEACTNCHGPHGGQKKFFLEASGRELCQKCHGEFLGKIQEFKTTHQPMIEGKSCENCHSPHASNQERLLAMPVGDLCLGCHNTQVQAADRMITNIEAQLEGGKYPHGPLQKGNCVACHQAHGSDHPRILRKAFPAEFYTAYTDAAYDLCFDCHDKKVVLAENSTATGFRNGTRNLHFLHVNREKGRSCRACHAEHTSMQEKHIRSEVPFGKWSMKVEFTKTDTGGGCSTGCHMPYNYDRENPVVNKRPEPELAVETPAPVTPAATPAEQTHPAAE